MVGLGWTLISDIAPENMAGLRRAYLISVPIWPRYRTTNNWCDYYFRRVISFTLIYVS